MAACATLLALASCHREPKHSSKSATALLSGPRLLLHETSHDFGSAVEGDVLRHSFPITNIGPLPLEIRNISTTPSCAGIPLPQALSPGTGGTIEVTCHLEGGYRTIDDTLTVTSNDENDEAQVLRVRASVTPLLAFDAPMVDLEMPFGEERTATVGLVGARLPQAALVAKKPDHKDLELALTPLDGGVGRSLSVHAKGAHVGKFVGNLVVETGLPRPKEVSIPYSLRVTGTLDVSPTNPMINLRIRGPKGVMLDVKSSQEGFAVREVKVAEGPYAASFERGEREGTYRVKVTVREERIPKDTRGVSGKVVISSNDRTEPVKEIAVLGFGKLNAAPAEDAGD